jgi:hypothetical protein
MRLEDLPASGSPIFMTKFGLRGRSAQHFTPQCPPKQSNGPELKNLFRLNPYPVDIAGVVVENNAEAGGPHRKGASKRTPQRKILCRIFPKKAFLICRGVIPNLKPRPFPSPRLLSLHLLISQPEAVVDGFGQILSGSQIVHGGLNRFMAEQELDLFDGAA